jgi:hypothetical protein
MDKSKFLERVEVITESGCWLWMGPVMKNGYGVVSRSPIKSRLAHRVAYALFKGHVPSNLCVLHSCDVPSCVNPNHLWLGTQLENIFDSLNKGRHAKGSEYESAKLNEQAVREIRSSKLRGCELAKKYGVSQSVISTIRSRTVWKHVN